MSRPSRYLTLTKKQDAALRNLELSPHINTKVRLRASIIRLNHTGWNATKLALHFNRNEQSIHNDIDRYEQHGIKGLTDGKSSGQPTKFTTEITAFIQQLLEQNRVWNSDLLRAEIEQRFGVRIKREAIRLKLLELGYSWKRTRYAPGKTPDPVIVAEHQAELEALKKGRWTKPQP